MVKIRLSRVGRKHYATYRLVVTPAREKRESRAIEFLGHYNPHTKVIVIDAERAKYWLSVGAQPSETVKHLFVKQKIVETTNEKKTFAKKPGKKKTERQAAAEAKAEAKAAEVKASE